MSLPPLILDSGLKAFQGGIDELIERLSGKEGGLAPADWTDIHVQNMEHPELGRLIRIF